MSQITRLHYFNAVVELGSISAASQLYNVQPSSISRQIIALEKELSVRLLSRTTRNIGLTEAGRKYYEYSQRIVAELDEAKRVVNDLQESPKGLLRLNLTVGFGESVVLPLIPLFLEQYPAIKVELDLTEKVVDLVEDNIDIAIRSGKLEDSSLIATKLMDNNFIPCASPHYLSKHPEIVSPDDLIKHQCIHYGYSGWQSWYLLANKKQSLNLEKTISVNSVNGQKQLILNHAGIALIPQWAVKSELEEKSLLQLLPQYTFSPNEHLTSTYGIYLNRQFIAPKIRVFLDFIKKTIIENSH
ncbi:transcriptional regulator, LysR family protein [Marinomonas sp. MED121]|uniref:LysR family transcriptional regulator n=1 Tax=Marinomonas sp. MED121 TaxID=314277 RepID=UPI0000690B89|nr:LysR family transcriptional regulator [Marinomonas sp. MED121]EAQ66133.1 transcriptional regulator, LysR family protein [Marinomonas sp. MED121]